VAAIKGHDLTLLLSLNFFTICLVKIKLKALKNFVLPKMLEVVPGKRKETQELLW
jgi:hypothetical protein